MSNINNPTPIGTTNGTGGNYIDRVVGVSVPYPALSLGSKAVSITVQGVKATDSITATINASAALTAGLAIGGARVTAANTVEVTFVTPIALGLSAGSVKLDFLIVGTR